MEISTGICSCVSVPLIVSGVNYNYNMTTRVLFFLPVLSKATLYLNSKLYS